jgi:ribosomal protein S18 acetylase RimI-like enzyme
MMNDEMTLNIVHARNHMPDHYGRDIEGQRAIRFMDNSGKIRAELVWRYATGPNVEITEFGIFDEKDRRLGLGTRLLNEGIRDMKDFSEKWGHTIRRVFLFCERGNAPARAFYEARGFTLDAQLEDYYEEEGGAVLYSRAIIDL